MEGSTSMMLLISAIYFRNFLGGLFSLTALLGASPSSLNVYNSHLGLLTKMEEDNSSYPPEF
jgi:hypothetical protein